MVNAESDIYIKAIKYQIKPKETSDDKLKKKNRQNLFYFLK
jgi:hypothetical protein